MVIVSTLQLQIIIQIVKGDNLREKSNLMSISTNNLSWCYCTQWAMKAVVALQQLALQYMEA